MSFSRNAYTSTYLSLIVFAMMPLISLFAQSSSSKPQTDSKTIEAGNSTDSGQAKVADDKNQTTKDENKDQDQKESPLVDSPLENAPDVPEQVLPPWAKDETRSDLPDLKDLTPRDLLIDVDQGELEHLYDYEAIEPDDLILIKILYRMQRFSLEEVRHFVQQTQSVVPSAIAQDPGTNRLKMFRLKGRVTEVERHDLIDRVAELYELVDSNGNPSKFKSYYRVHTVLEPGNQLSTICVVDVPDVWKSVTEIDEPFACSGMFLKVNSREEDPADLLFSAYRLEWYPEANSLDAGLTAGELLLAKHGFDVSLLEDARARNRKSIDATDTECFYQMLGTASKLSAEDFSGMAVPEFDLLELMNHASKNHGHVFNLQADIRNVTEVKIDQDYYRQQLGMDRYYQLDGFINTDVEIVDPELKEKGAPSYGKRYPISVCVASLPEGMKADSERVYQVSLPVFFFKIWPYQSQWTRQFKERIQHTSPLLIGVQPDVESQAASSPFTTVLMAVVCFLLFAFIWIGFWKLTKKGRPTERGKFQIGGNLTDKGLETEASSGTKAADMPKIDP